MPVSDFNKCVAKECFNARGFIFFFIDSFIDSNKYRLTSSFDILFEKLRNFSNIVKKLEI